MGYIFAADVQYRSILIQIFVVGSEIQCSAQMVASLSFKVIDIGTN